MSKKNRKNKAKFEAETFEAGLADAIAENRASTVEEAVAAVSAAIAGRSTPEVQEAIVQFGEMTAVFAVKIRDYLIAAGMEHDPVEEAIAGLGDDLGQLFGKVGEIAVMAAAAAKAEEAAEAVPAVVEAAAVEPEAVLVETRSSARATWAKGMPINNIDDALAWREMKIAEWRQSRA